MAPSMAVRAGVAILLGATCAAGLIAPRSTHKTLLRSSSNPDFLEDGLGEASSSYEARKPLLSPLGGVSVSPRGFVAILASPKDDDPQRALAVQIHRGDVDAVVSPTALTILQLLQGIDVATATQLPPDALARALDVEDGDAPRLAKVRVVPAASAAAAAPPPRCAAFEAAVGDAAARLRAALESKLGVALTEGAAADLLREHADDACKLDLAAFGEVTAAARRLALPVERDESVAFVLVAEDGATAPASPFLGLALALRHNAPLDVPAALWDAPRAVDAADLLAELPVKRAEDLVTDGARLSAHFAQMFDTASRAAAGAEPGDVRGSE